MAKVQTRRSLSLSCATHGKLHAASEKLGESMSQIIEQSIADFFALPNHEQWTIVVGIQARMRELHPVAPVVTVSLPVGMPPPSLRSTGRVVLSAAMPIGVSRELGEFVDDIVTRHLEIDGVIVTRQQVFEPALLMALDGAEREAKARAA